MTQKDDGRWDVDTYELIPVTDEIKADAATQERIDELMETLIRIICHILDIQKIRFLRKMILNSAVWTICIMSMRS